MFVLYFPRGGNRGPDSPIHATPKVVVSAGKWATILTCRPRAVCSVTAFLEPAIRTAEAPYDDVLAG
jgi:hypothetical protein